MKVQTPTTGPNRSAEAVSSRTAGPKKEIKGEAKAPAKESKSMAEISGRAKDLATARHVADNAPEVREARIAELRKKIQDKSYQTDPEAIADRMIQEHLEF